MHAFFYLNFNAIGYARALKLHRPQQECYFPWYVESWGDLRHSTRPHTLSHTFRKNKNKTHPQVILISKTII